MRIVVTGATGFIGKHVVATLSNDHSNELFVVSRTKPPLPAGRSTAIEADLASEGWTKSLPDEIDAVVHLAQSRFYRSFPDGARDVLKVNVDATSELLDWAHRQRVGRFILASSGSVYQPVARRLTEADGLRTDLFYPSSKIAAEAICGAYGALFTTIALRFFSVYGPGGTDGVIARLVARVANGEAVQLDGHAGMIITPTFVADAVDAIVGCLSFTSKSKTLQILNICGDEDVSLREICLACGELMQRNAHFIELDRPPLFLCATNARAKTELGWRPRHTMRAGLAELCASAVPSGSNAVRR
jgi:nucleoside-diphosphate-sugar epimerase